MMKKLIYLGMMIFCIPLLIGAAKMNENHLELNSCQFAWDDFLNLLENLDCIECEIIKVNYGELKDSYFRISFVERNIFFKKDIHQDCGLFLKLYSEIIDGEIYGVYELIDLAAGSPEDGGRVGKY